MKLRAYIVQEKRSWLLFSIFHAFTVVALMISMNLGCTLGLCLQEWPDIKRRYPLTEDPILISERNTECSVPITYSRRCVHLVSSNSIRQQPGYLHKSNLGGSRSQHTDKHPKLFSQTYNEGLRSYAKSLLLTSHEHLILQLVKNM